MDSNTAASYEEEKRIEGDIDEATGFGEQSELNAREAEFQEKDNQEVEIRIVEVQVRDGKLGSKHVVYKLKGKDREGEFEIFRRYSDFDHIRAMLVQRWPGLVIPSIPSKKSVGNMDSAFVKDRMKFLEIFLIRISEQPLLYYSEEFQTFLRNNTTDLEKTLNQLKKQTAGDILLKYREVFSAFAEKEVNSELASSILNFQMVLIKILAYFENYKKTAGAMVAAKAKYYEMLSNYLIKQRLNDHLSLCEATFREKVLADYEKQCLPEYESSKEASKLFQTFAENQNAQPAKKILSSFEYIYDFVRITEKDIKTFLEALEQRNKYQVAKEKLIEKQRSLGLEHQSVLSGKTTMKSLITRKSKDGEIEAVEKQIDEVKRELEYTTKLHDFITLIIGLQEMKQFKEKKILRYYKVVKKASSNEVQQLSEVRKFWSMVLEDEAVNKAARASGLIREVGGSEEYSQPTEEHFQPTEENTQQTEEYSQPREEGTEEVAENQQNYE